MEGLAIIASGRTSLTQSSPFNIIVVIVVRLTFLDFRHTNCVLSTFGGNSDRLYRAGTRAGTRSGNAFRERECVPVLTLLGETATNCLVPERVPGIFDSKSNTHVHGSGVNDKRRSYDNHRKVVCLDIAKFTCLCIFFFSQTGPKNLDPSRFAVWIHASV